MQTNILNDKKKLTDKIASIKTSRAKLAENIQIAVQGAVWHVYAHGDSVFLNRLLRAVGPAMQKKLKSFILHFAPVHANVKKGSDDIVQTKAGTGKDMSGEEKITMANEKAGDLPFWQDWTKENTENAAPKPFNFKGEIEKLVTKLEKVAISDDQIATVKAFQHYLELIRSGTIYEFSHEPNTEAEAALESQTKTVVKASAGKKSAETV